MIGVDLELAAQPADLASESGEAIDPLAAWKVMMRNEKPGGHGERSVAVGVLDMAVWDAVAKIAGQPLYRLLAARYRDGVADDKVAVYAAGGYYYPGTNLAALQNEMRAYLDLGYTRVKMKIGGASLGEDLHRIEAVLKVVGSGQNLAVDANGRFDLKTALAYADALAPYDRDAAQALEVGGDSLGDPAADPVVGRVAPNVGEGEHGEQLRLGRGAEVRLDVTAVLGDRERFL